MKFRKNIRQQLDDICPDLLLYKAKKRQLTDTLCRLKVDYLKLGGTELRMGKAMLIQAEILRIEEELMDVRKRYREYYNKLVSIIDGLNDEIDEYDISMQLDESEDKTCIYGKVSILKIKSDSEYVMYKNERTINIK